MLRLNLKILSKLAILIIIYSLFTGCNKPKDDYFINIKSSIINGDYSKSLELIKAYEENHPGTDKFSYYKALALNRMGKNDDALKVCNEQIINNKNDANIYDLKATILSDQKLYYEALNAVDKAIKLNNKALFLNNKAFILNNLKEYTESIKYSNKALKLNPSFDMAYVNKGFSTFSIKQPQEAIKLYNKALSINPHNDIAYYNKSQALFVIGDVNNSLTAINSALKLNPKNLEYLNKKAELFILSSQYNAAKLVLNNALSINSRYPATYKNLSLLSYYRNDFPKALKNIELAQSYKNDEHAYIALKAKIYLAMGDFSKAHEQCNLSIAANIQHEDIYNVLAEIYTKEYDYKNALLNIDTSLQLNTMNLDAYINKARILYDKHNYNKCISYAEDLRKFFPYNLELINLISKSYANLSEHELAIDSYKNGLKKTYANEGLYYNIANEYLSLSNFEQALKNLQFALNLNPSSSNYMNLKNKLTLYAKTKGLHLYEFVKNNYLFLSQSPDFEQKSESIKNADNLTTKDITKYIAGINEISDPNTYVISGKEYKMIKKYNEIEIVKLEELLMGLYYIKIDSFNFSTGIKVIEELETLDNPADKNLTIDLRDNKSALLNPVYDIVDCLLPKCITHYEIKQNGIVPYSSDPYFLSFNKIFILVNENSSSSSTLLASTLKNNLENVIILGKPTNSHRVGQVVYEDVINEYYLYLTSHFWNFTEQKPDSTLLTPDTFVETDILDNYINIIDNLLNQ